jgi:peptidoglycan/LPS O-acetylase OafA/YrhL
VPYFGIGLIYMLPIRLAIGFPSYQGRTAAQLLTNFLMSSDVGHLWFLPALFVMFLLAELILTAAEKLPLAKKAPAVFLCVAALCLYMEGYRISFGYAPIQSAYGNLLWFALGYGLCAYRDLVQTIYRSLAVKVLLGALALALLGYQILVAPMSVTMTLAAKGLLIASVYGMMPERTCSVVEKIDRNSFGVYLFHSPLIYITFALIPNGHPAVVVFINLVVFGAVAYGLTELARKTKLRLLIGE